MSPDIRVPLREKTYESSPRSARSFGHATETSHTRTCGASRETASGAEGRPTALSSETTAEKHKDGRPLPFAAGPKEAHAEFRKPTPPLPPSHPLRPTRTKGWRMEVSVRHPCTSPQMFIGALEVDLSRLSWANVYITHSPITIAIYQDRHQEVSMNSLLES